MNKLKRIASCERSEHLTTGRSKRPRLFEDDDNVSVQEKPKESCVRNASQHPESKECCNCFQGSAPQHVSVYNMVALKCLGALHLEQGDLKVAETFFNMALRMGRHLLGFHPEVAAMLNKLGNLYYKMNDVNSAMTCYEEGLDVERTVLTPHHHPRIIITMTNIARIYELRKEYPEALLAYNEVRTLQEEAFGSSSIEIAATHSSMGLMQYNMMCYKGAFDSYQEALRVRRKHCETDEHPDIASSLNSLGLVLFKQNLYEQGHKCFMESLQIYTKLYGPNHRLVPTLWYNIATVNIEQGEDERAIVLYNGAIRVEQAALGPDHPEISRTLQQIGQVLQQAGRLAEASDMFHQAIRIERKNSSLQSVAKVLYSIGNIQLQQGDVSGMMGSYIEASRMLEGIQLLSDVTLVDEGYNLNELRKMNPASAPVA
jgi:tetratricopeptide (TPR) repeat protein